MAFKYIICEGDVTTHGGKVLEGTGFITIEGRKVALISHNVFCPKCNGNFPIIEDSNPMSYMGQNVALEGMKTACGAELIASQKLAKVEISPGMNRSTFMQNQPEILTAENVPKNHFASTNPVFYEENSEIICEHEDGAIEVAKFIVEEIQRNVNSDIVKRMKALNEEAEDRLDNHLNYTELPYGIGMPVTSAKAAALALLTKQVRTKGVWDHKEFIKENYAYATVKQRPYNSVKGKGQIVLMDSYIHKYKNHDYFYDVWSNIHYGYIGAFCKFSESLLLDGAGMEQMVDDMLRKKVPEHKGMPGLRGFDGVADHQSVLLGMRLYEKFGEDVENLTHQDILDGLEGVSGLGFSRILHICLDNSEQKITED